MNDDFLEIPDFLDRRKNPITNATSLPASSPPHHHKEVVKVKPILGSPPPPKKVNIQAQTSAILSVIEGKLDDNEINEEWDLYNFLLARDASVNIAQVIVDRFYARAEGLIEILQNQDDLICKYPDYAKGLIRIYAKLVDDAQLYIDNKKRTRRTVRKYRIRAERVIKHLQYAKTYDKFKLVSIDPTKIIGASELWTYNITSSIVTVYRAARNRTLTLRRGVVIDFDDEQSMGKRVGRRAQQVIQVIFEHTRRDLQGLMDELNTDPIPPKRINKNTVLLKVF